MVGPIWPNLGKIGKFLVLKKITILPRGAKFAQPGQKIFFWISIANFSIFQKFDVFLVENDGLGYSYDISIVKLVKKPL